MKLAVSVGSTLVPGDLSTRFILTHLLVFGRKRLIFSQHFLGSFVCLSASSCIYESLAFLTIALA